MASRSLIRVRNLNTPPFLLLLWWFDSGCHLYVDVRTRRLSPRGIFAQNAKTLMIAHVVYVWYLIILILTSYFLTYFSLLILIIEYSK